MLTLKCAFKHRPGGPWSDEDYDVFDGGIGLNPNRLGRYFLT